MSFSVAPRVLFHPAVGGDRLRRVCVGCSHTSTNIVSFRPKCWSSFLTLKYEAYGTRRRACTIRAQQEDSALVEEENPESANSSTDSASETEPTTLKDTLTSLKAQVSSGELDNSLLETFLANVETDLQAAASAAASKVSELEAQCAKFQDQYLRLNADFENFRKRTASEKASIAENAKGDVMSALLPVIDAFELAKSQLKVTTEAEEKLANSYQGLYRQLVDIFKGLGLEAVVAEGSRFDPAVHEAILREPNNQWEDDTVVQEFRKGFKLGDKLLRPAMVKVSYREEVAPSGNGAQPAAEEAAAAAEA